ncbi:hypothetical protein [Profundibacter sp.]|uniref:hypothetical protein n=1 Tax=Profundibacter sp. TaxID=3101071 RepID=UPI003D0D17E8
MRLLVSLIFAVSLMFGQIVAASPRDDAEYIAESMLSESGREWAIKAIAGIYVSHFTKELDKHSVRVLDSDRFAEMIPMNVVEPWILRWKELLAGGLLKVYTPAQLAQIANNRAMPKSW